VRLSVIAVVAAGLLTACPRRRAAAPDTLAPAQTQTIAPAQAAPAPTGTDAMTQTVDIEDSRSEGESGTIASPKPNAKPPGPKPVAPKGESKKKH